MTTPLNEPQQFERYVNEDGTLTHAGIILFKQFFDRMVDNEERLTAGGL